MVRRLALSLATATTLVTITYEQRALAGWAAQIPSAQQAQIPPPEPASWGTLDTILETNQPQRFSAACLRYEEGVRDLQTKLLCGKWLFLYGNFGATGIPAPFIDVFLRSFNSQTRQSHVGPSFSRLGMIPDPRSKKGLPLGLAEGARLNGHRTYVFTCASCHLGRIENSNEKFAIGAPNHDFQYGKLIAAVSAFPRTTHLWTRHSVSPSVRQTLRPLTHEAFRKPWIKAFLDIASVSMFSLLLSGKIPDFPLLEQDQHLSWLPGTMDFAIKPLPFSDEAHVVTKIPMIWEQPSPNELALRPSDSALLGHTGGARSLYEFLRAFVATSGGDTQRWDDAALEPLADFIYALKAPPNPTLLSADAIERGRLLFQAHGCPSCHGRSNMSGDDLFAIGPYETDTTLSVDPAITQWGMGAQLNGTSASNLLPPLTGQIKSPGLLGLWAQKRYLHNGSLTLKELFCLGTDRRSEPELSPPFGRQGHWMTCDLPDNETKNAIIDFLLSGVR
jgi:hypothetical protein